MPAAFADFLQGHLGTVEPLFLKSALTWWNLHTTGKEEYAKEAERLSKEIQKIYASGEDYRLVKEWWDNARPTDALLRRQLQLLRIEYTCGQKPAEDIEALAKLETEVNQLYTNFRGVVGGKELSNNELNDILKKSDDMALRKEAWEASKQIGKLAEAKVRELAHLRNKIAKRIGFEDHFALAMFANEIDEKQLFDLLNDLKEKTDPVWKELKGGLDAELAKRFKVKPEELRSWHYADPFFQEVPPLTGIDLDPLFTEASLEDLTTRTYDSLGMDIRDILLRSDLYERPGKDQHAFCTHIDRKGDIRVLCNVRKDARWMETMLHEFGHAVYDKYTDMTLPYFLRGPAHSLTTEAIAILFGNLAENPDWLREFAGVSRERLATLSGPLAQRLRLSRLIFLRWALVVVSFEREMYRNPDRELNQLWWDLVERFQWVKRPEGRNAPDYAAKIHVALVPCYYQNYILGNLMASQVLAHARAKLGGFVRNAAAGRFLIDRVFRPGATMPWNELIAHATGTPLRPDAWVSEVKGAKGSTQAAPAKAAPKKAAKAKKPATKRPVAKKAAPKKLKAKKPVARKTKAVKRAAPKKTRRQLARVGGKRRK